MAKKKTTHTPVHVRARDIPPPSTISAAAQKILSDAVSLPRMTWPSPDDKVAWRRQLAVGDSARREMVAAMLASARAAIETTWIAGVLCYDCTPRGGAPGGGPVYLFAHDGAFVAGGGDFARAQGARTADAIGARTISVDYRMPPDHPFPAHRRTASQSTRRCSRRSIPRAWSSGEAPQAATSPPPRRS